MAKRTNRLSRWEVDEVDLRSLAETLDQLPSTASPQEHGVLRRLPSVIRSNREARRLTERLEKPLFVNTDGAHRYGLAGLAYESAALGNRVELVACDYSVEAEYLAILMAMEDADRALRGAIVFRTDSATVANLNTGNTLRAAQYSERVSKLLERHENWWIVRVPRRSNIPADKLARRPFDEMGQRGRELARVRYEQRRRELRIGHL